MLRKLLAIALLLPSLAIMMSNQSLIQTAQAMRPIDDGSGGSGGSGQTTSIPEYNITTSPGYPWDPNPITPGDVLLQGQSLSVNQSLVSKSGVYRLIFQADGNLVVYENGRGVWDSATSGYYVGNRSRLTMQGDGNLVIYNSNNYGYWDTGGRSSSGFNTALPAGGYYLRIQDDGNLVVYSRWGIDPAYFYARYGLSLGVWDRHCCKHGNRH